MDKLLDPEFLRETLDGPTGNPLSSSMEPVPVSTLRASIGRISGRLWLDFINMSETTAAAWCILIAIVGTLALKGIA
jgi:hypothetical protein